MSRNALGSDAFCYLLVILVEQEQPCGIKKLILTSKVIISKDILVFMVTISEHLEEKY